MTTKKQQEKYDQNYQDLKDAAAKMLGMTWPEIMQSISDSIEITYDDEGKAIVSIDTVLPPEK